jgi:uncharacterized protein (TIGR02391 family)
MDKKGLLGFLNEKMKEVHHLHILPPDNKDFPIWCKTIEGVLLKYSGKDSFEYKTFTEAGKIYGVIEDDFTEYGKALVRRETALASIIKTLETIGDEEPLNIKNTVESPIDLFDAMQFHQKVVNASRALFENEHYAQAIFEAFKAVENFVQDKSDLKIFGTNLMETVFNEENPIIKVPEAGHYYKDVQRGFKHLFVGATQAIRNPKAHKEIEQKDPYITLQYLGFASFLLKRIDYWEAGIS